MSPDRLWWPYSPPGLPVLPAGIPPGGGGLGLPLLSLPQGLILGGRRGWTSPPSYSNRLVLEQRLTERDRRRISPPGSSRSDVDDSYSYSSSWSAGGEDLRRRAERPRPSEPIMVVGHRSWSLDRLRRRP